VYGIGAKPEYVIAGERRGIRELLDFDGERGICGYSRQLLFDVFASLNPFDPRRISLGRARWG